MAWQNVKGTGVVIRCDEVQRTGLPASLSWRLGVRPCQLAQQHAVCSKSCYFIGGYYEGCRITHQIFLVEHELPRTRYQ